MVISMNKAVEFLKKAGVFFVATDDAGQPRLRPFGAVIEYNGKAYFCTNNTKEVFRQLVKNTKVEISAMGEEGSWIRFTGNAVVDKSEEAKAAMLEANPGLSRMYKLGDGLFEVFYIDSGKCSIFKGNEAESFDA